MTRGMLKIGVLATLLLASASAYADDPTGVLLSEQRWAEGQTAGHHGAQQAQFSDVGPCQAGMQSEPFPNAQGYRCVPNE